MGCLYFRSDKIIINSTMINKINRYEEPLCSTVEFEVGGVILTTSDLNSENFTLDEFEKLKDVEW